MVATNTSTSAGQAGPVDDTPRMSIMGPVQQGHSALAVIDPVGMEKLFFVSTYSDVDPDSPAPKQHGYQRDPMEKRFPQIARYYMEGGPITPLVVSVRVREDEIADFERLFNAGAIQRIHGRWHKAVVSVVDGQHRYKSLVKAHQDDPAFRPLAPVLLLYGLDYVNEARTFDAINTNQRKLPKALIEVTAGDITAQGEKTHAQRVREITFALAREKDSVWFDQINMTGARDPDRSVTYEGLRRSTSNMFTANLIKRLETRGIKPEEVAKSYWQLISEACQIAWNNRQPESLEPPKENEKLPAIQYRIKDLVGVAALSKLGHDIVSSALEAPDTEGNGSGFDERMVDLVSKLSEVDWRKNPTNPWMASQAGFAGQKDLYDILYALVYMDRRPGESADD